MSDAPVRYRNTVLYDRGGQKVTGDVLLHADGSWSASNGDEDVICLLYTSPSPRDLH